MLFSVVLFSLTFGFSAPPTLAEVPVLLTEKDLQTIVSDNNFVAVFWRSGLKNEDSYDMEGEWIS